MYAEIKSNFSVNNCYQIFILRQFDILIEL